MHVHLTTSPRSALLLSLLFDLSSVTSAPETAKLLMRSLVRWRTLSGMLAIQATDTLLSKTSLHLPPLFVIPVRVYEWILRFLGRVAVCHEIVMKSPVSRANRHELHWNDPVVPHPILTIGIVIFSIQNNITIFLQKKVDHIGRSNTLVKNKSRKRNNCSEEEEDKVWRMRRDRFFRKCRKRSGKDEEDVSKMRRMRMRKDQYSFRYNPSDLILGQYNERGKEREREKKRKREKERKNKRKRKWKRKRKRKRRKKINKVKTKKPEKKKKKWERPNPYFLVH